MSNAYDIFFQRYAGLYFAGLVDWAWFKAQAIVESGLNPEAVSPAGARGIMQLMPATSAELSRLLWIDDDPFDPEIGILMGIRYMFRLWSTWAQPRGIERLRFCQASYNAGPGHIARAARLAGNKNSWHRVAQVLPQVTGCHARETVSYVEKIEKTRAGILAGPGPLVAQPVPDIPLETGIAGTGKHYQDKTGRTT